jgi:hypothetical protein
VKGWVVSGEEALSLIGDYRSKLSNSCEIAVGGSAHLLPDALRVAVVGARRDRLPVHLNPSSERRDARHKCEAREFKVTIDLVSSTTEESLSQGSGILSPNKKNKMEPRVGEGCSRKRMTGREVSQVRVN